MWGTIGAIRALGWAIAITTSVAPALAGRTERVSVGQQGAQADRHSEQPAISPDGRFVAFRSDATNLVPGDTNGVPDIFVRDRQTSMTERVSVGRKGVQGDEASHQPSISADGRFVAFISFATNLVPGDTSNDGDVFVHDRRTGKTERVSVPRRKGQQPNASSIFPAISGDGRVVAFASLATNLVPGDIEDSNGSLDVFAVDRRTGKAERVSIGLGGVQGNGTSEGPALSSDGRFVAFTSSASNLVPNDTNLGTDVFVLDRQTHAMRRVSVAPDGNQIDGDSRKAGISGDGRFITFDVRFNMGGGHEVFVHDRLAGITANVTSDTLGCFGPAISPDGRFVAFESWDDFLVPGDSNGRIDVFVTDRRTGGITRVSVGRRGADSNSGSLQPAIAAGARFIGFTSEADNLVSGDTNGELDVFVRSR